MVRNQAHVTLKITKCTTIGPPRIGKTCLKNLLIGQEWDVEAGTASTDVMEAPEWVECYGLEEEKGAEELWKLVSKEQQKGELIRAVNRPTTSSTQPATPPSETSSTLPSGTQDPTTSSDAPPPTTPSDVQQATLPSHITSTPTNAQDSTTPSDIEVRATPSSAPPSTAKPDATQKPATVWQALEALAGACSSEALQDFLKDKEGKVLGERRLVHFIDTGGQGIYHDIHPVLITSPSIYLVVFSLKDFYQKNGEERLRYFRSGLIQRPLRSIYTFGTNIPEKKDHLQLHPEAPKIFIVGTHLDQVPPDSQENFLDTVGKMIEEEISSKPYQQFVQYDTKDRSFWAVDNTQAGRKQDEATKEYISTLRLMVQDRSMEMSVKVPLPWMLLKMVLDGSRVRCCKYSELLKEACKLSYVREGSPEVDLDTMLWLFHTLGLLYHKVPSGCSKEDSLVFIDPDCLYLATSDFLMAAKEEIEEGQKLIEKRGHHQTQAATTEEIGDSQGGNYKEQQQGSTLLAQRNMEMARRRKPLLQLADPFDTSKGQDAPHLGSLTARKRKPLLQLADPFDVSKCQDAPHLGSLALRGRNSATAQKPTPVQKNLRGGVESMKVFERISSNVRDFLFDMHKVLHSLEHTVMKVGKEHPDVVSQNLVHIQKGVEEKNRSPQDANTLQSKYRILAQEMVFKLINSVRKVLKSAALEDEKLQLDRVMKDFWFQCRMTRRSIEVNEFHHLLLLLTELRIIAKLNPDCYVIPATLPQCHDQMIPVEEGIEPLLFTLTSQDDLTYYLPSGLFCCLISELVTDAGWTVNPLGRTHVVFTHESFTGKVHVLEHESYIEIKVESTLKVKIVCNIVREQIGDRINHVYRMIYDPPESTSAVVGFKCNCGRGAANTPHFAAYEEDEFECCMRCLLQGSTDLHICPLTQQQMVWFPHVDVAGMQ